MSDRMDIFDGVKWVFVDLDDTIWDFSENSSIALKLLYENSEILRSAYPDYDEYDEMYHLKNDELWNLYHHGEISQEYLKIERFRWLLSRKNVMLADIDSVSGAMNEWYLNRLSECTVVVDGAHELMSALSKRFLIGILSNGFLNVQYRKLYGSGLSKYVQRMIVSDEISVQKPDKRLFDYALVETGAEASTSVMIGDNPDADIKGAINAGWRTIYFDRKRRGVSGADPDMIVSDLKEILSVV